VDSKSPVSEKTILPVLEVLWSGCVSSVEEIRYMCSSFLVKSLEKSTLSSEREKFINRCAVSLTKHVSTHILSLLQALLQCIPRGSKGISRSTVIRSLISEHAVLDHVLALAESVRFLFDVALRIFRFVQVMWSKRPTQKLQSRNVWSLQSSCIKILFYRLISNCCSAFGSALKGAILLNSCLNFATGSSLHFILLSGSTIVFSLSNPGSSQFLIQTTTVVRFFKDILCSLDVDLFSAEIFKCFSEFLISTNVSKGKVPLSSSFILFKAI